MIDSSVFDWIEGLLAETDQRWTANQSEVPSIIYHYTSDKAFREIIQTATLRASDTSGLPDKDELTRAAELFRTIAQERALVAAERGRSDLYPARLLGLTYARPTLTRCFVTSMTTAEDDPAMWASYAADGSGVAIGFDSSQLMLLNESPSQHLGFFEVSYEDFQQQAFFEWLLHRWESQAMLPSTMNAGHGQEYLLSRFGVAIGCAAAVFPRMKNASFKPEKEWRLAHAHVSRNTGCCEVQAADSRAYVDLNFLRLASTLPVASLWIGPTNEATERRLERFMREHGHTVQIRMSAHRR